MAHTPPIPVLKKSAEPAAFYWALVAVILPFMIAAGVLAWFSDGVYQDDDLAHVQMARWAWQDPRWLLHVWGRPGFTVPYALVANLGNMATGFFACRLLSVVIAGASAFLAAMCARQLGSKHPAWTAAALFLMPLYFQLGYTTLTETVCGLYLIAGTYLLLLDRLRWAAAVLALAPLARMESIAFFIPLGLYLLWRRDWRAILLLTWASVLWNVLSHFWMWSLPVLSYVAPKRDGYYGYGNWLHYLVQWSELATPAGVGLAFAGAATWWRMPPALEKGKLEVAGDLETYSTPSPGSLRSPTSPSERERGTADSPPCEGRNATIQLASWLIPVGALASVALHTWIYHKSSFDGGGYPRFLIPACPWLAICAAWAVEQLLATQTPPPCRGRGGWGDVHFGISAFRQLFCTHPRLAPLNDLSLQRSGALLPLLILIGVTGSFGAVWYNSYQPNGTFQWVWWGQQVIALWYTTPAIVLAALLAMIFRRLWCAWLLMFCLMGSVGWNWGWRAKPHKLLPQQQLMAQAVAFVRQTDPPGKLREIISYSPWPAYFDEQTHLVSHLQPQDRWPKGEAGLVFIHDSEHSEREYPVKKLQQFPHRVVLQLNLNNPWYHDPYVEVFERK